MMATAPKARAQRPRGSRTATLSNARLAQRLDDILGIAWWCGLNPRQLADIKEGARRLREVAGRK